MGGEGSGRKPDLTRQILNASQHQRNQQVTPIGTEIILPNFSGVSQHPESKGTFLKLDASNDPITNDLQITGDLTVQDDTGTSSLFIRDPTSPATTYTQFAQSNVSSVLRNFGSLPLEIKSATGDVYLDQTGVTNRLIIRNSAGDDTIIISDDSSMASDNSTLSFSSSTSNIDINSNNLINVAEPTNASDGATKNYADVIAIVMGTAL